MRSLKWLLQAGAVRGSVTDMETVCVRALSSVLCVCPHIHTLSLALAPRVAPRCDLRSSRRSSQRGSLYP